MWKFTLVCASLFTMVLSISASAVLAQTMWVAPNGSDTNNCGQTTPCATFQGTYNKGGVVEINCLGSGHYGPIAITGSLTLDCGAGNVGNIASSDNAAITISTSAAATVIIRHLALNGLATNNVNANGIIAEPFFGGTLIVEDCMIHGYHSGIGIFFQPSSGRGLLQVSNSQIFDNLDGLQVFPASGQIASVTLNKVELVGNASHGLILDGNVVAGTMRDSVVGENGGNGIFAFASQVFFTVEESSIVDNLSNGIQTSSAGSSVTVTASTISGNGTGIQATQGAIVSSGNNTLNENGSNGIFTSTKALQ